MHILLTSGTVRQQTKLTKPLYEKRQAVVSKIPNFWPLVLEQAPPDIDEFIQPTDSAILLTALTGLSVSRFEIENGNNGDPRSVAIRLEFSENEYFEDKVLEKKFWYRHDKDGDGSLVSEPVDIKWKAGKDQTNGLLGMVKAVWDEEVAAGKQWSPVKPSEYTAKQKALKEKIEKVGLGGMSFFAWFGYRGSRISAEASKAAKEKVAAEREAHKRGENTDQEMDDDDDEEEEDEMELEIFPEGDSLAVAISDDLWPGALRYFSE